MHEPAGEPGPTAAIAHSRLLRPHSTRRLSNALYHVNATANSLRQHELALMIDPPVLPDEWAAGLDELQTELYLLVQYSRDAWRKLEWLQRSAPKDYERALEALVLILRGEAALAELRAA